MFATAQASYLRVLFVSGLIAASSLTPASPGPASPSQKTLPARKAQIVENYGKLPLSFEANIGQADKSVKFLSRGSGYGLYLTGNEAVLELQDSGVRIQDSGPRAKPLGAVSGWQRTTDHGLRTTDSFLRMKIVNANQDAAVTGADELPGKVNYFLGNDPAKWHTSVPTYAKVRYAGIYPGIDLVYYGNPSAGGQLEYDFVVAPGADPGVITLAVGAQGQERNSKLENRNSADHASLQIARDGDLVIRTDAGEIRFRKPVVYQGQDSGFRIRDSGAKNLQQSAASNRKSPITNRESVEGRFLLDAQNRVHFGLGAYDHTRPLVIDPALVYSTFLGGSGGDAATAITVDTAGNAYVAGRTSSTDFPVSPGAFQTKNEAAANSTFTAFVTKLNPTGTALVYSTYLGGSGTSSGGDTVNAIAVDTAGNVYVAGQTYSTDFPVTQGAFQTTNRAAANGDANAFVTKLNPTGTALVYSTYVGGSGLSVNTPLSGDEGRAIAVDATGDAYVSGETFSVDFPVTSGAYQTTNHGAASDKSNAFITKLNPTGTALVYSTYLGGSGDVYSSASTTLLAVDGSGNAYIAGATSSTDFPVTAGAFQTTNHAAANRFNNVFVTKLDPTGTALVYSTYLGGSGTGACCGGDMAYGVALDSSGNVYVTGATGSTDFPVTTGAFQTTNHGAAMEVSNAFVTKLNPTGTALVYSTYLGGSGGVINLMPTLELGAGDQASGLAVDSSGNAYVTGMTPSNNFPVTEGAYQTTNQDQPPCGAGCIGGYNAFITELNSTGSALVYSTYLGGNGFNLLDFVGVIVFGNGDQASALALDNSGNVYVTGLAVSFDFPVTAGAFQTTVNSRNGNAFVTKLNMGATSTAITPTVTVTPASSTITSGRPLTVTVSASGGSDSPTPTGTVTLASGTYTSAATTLSDGSATFDIPAGSLLAEPAGYSAPDVLIAKYVPDAASSSTYNFSTGQGSVNVVSPNISVTPSSSTLTWAQSQSQALSVAMVATGGTGNPTPTGTVTLTTGSYSSGATALSGGSATVSIPAGTLTTGFNILYVSYSGDSNYAAVGIAGSALVTVGSVTVSVVPSSSSITTAQALSVAITVSAGSGNPIPTGMVTLLSANYSSATTPLTSGSATITIPAGSLPVGVDPLNVSYGDGNYAGASGYASVTVTAGTPGFTITGTAVTVGAGLVAMSTITVTPAGGFTGSVALTAAITSSPNGAQSLPTLGFGGTSPVSITGASAGTATLMIDTTPGNCAPGNVIGLRVPWYPAGGAALACLLLFVIPGRRRSWRRVPAMLALLAALACGMLACGGGSSGRNCPPATTAGNYTVTVTGTSGTIVATGTVALTVE
jgi:hypothetical protein